MIKIEVKIIPVDRIKVKREQVRESFDEDKLRMLADSIAEYGQLQPVIVKKEGPDYVLIAGERRLRAMIQNQVQEIAAVILTSEFSDDVLYQIQLVENIQREDLNPLERARAIKKLMKETGLNKKDVSRKLGVPRTTLTEWLNILEVSEKYQQEVLKEDSPLKLSHISLAKALASRTGDPTKLNQLLEGVLRYKFTREETRAIVEIIHKYLHIDLEEAFNAVLLRREHKRISQEKEICRQVSIERDPGKLLVESFNNFSTRLEKFLEEVDYIEDNDKRDLLEEFLYICQLMGIMLPEMKDAYRVNKENLAGILDK
ncbi:MAG: ParB/RepB/Spo0J family partition protein [Halanaerobiales bacterium]|nr:ParB/RepB/Spo0J family partition protein [Bacillota bacterium]